MKPGQGLIRCFTICLPVIFTLGTAAVVATPSPPGGAARQKDKDEDPHVDVTQSPRLEAQGKRTDVMLDKIPAPPDGYAIARVDVVVRLRRKGR